MRSMAPPALFFVAVYFAGSKRLVQYFPGATPEGLAYSAAMGSVAVIGGNLAHKKGDAEWKRAGFIIAGLALSTILRPHVAKALIGRADLNLKASFRLAIVEGVLVGGVEMYVMSRGPSQLPRDSVRNKEIHESRVLGGISIHEMNRDAHQIRGFDKMVQEPWLLKQAQELCRGKAFCVDAIINVSLHEILDLDLLLSENTEKTPTVMVVNCKNHYSIVVYEPTEKRIYRFNSLTTEVNVYEQKVIDAMQRLFPVDEVICNKKTPQKGVDGWRCAFEVLYFLEHFLAGSSMDNVDAAPLPMESLARRLDVYYNFLKGVQCAIPKSHRMYFDVVLDDKPVKQLKNFMQNACTNGWVKKSEGSSVLEHQKQIECILIKLWMMEQKKRGTFQEFVDEMGEFTTNQRRFLDGALNRIDWAREAISGHFRHVYYETMRHPISPD